MTDEKVDLFDWTKLHPERAMQSCLELHFYLQLVECAGCGFFDMQRVRLEYKKFGRSRVQGAVRCRECGRLRQLRVIDLELEAEPLAGARTVLGPSRIFQPQMLLAGYDRFVASFAAQPQDLSVEDFWAQIDIVRLAIICANELIKFVPDSADRIPPELIYDECREHYAAHPTRYTRTYLQGLRDHMAIVDGRYRAECPRAAAEHLAKYGPPKLPQGAVGYIEDAAHAAWLKRGRVGDGRMIVKNQKLDAQHISGVRYIASEFENVTFHLCKMGYSTFDESLFTDCVIYGSYVQSSKFNRCQLTRCTIDNGRFSRSEFLGAVLIDCKLEPIELIVTDWNDARLLRVLIRDAQLQHSTWDGAVVENCDFQRSSLGELKQLGDRPFPMRGARFIDCDFRNTGWLHRDFSGATFIRCKFDGAWGPGGAHEGLVLEDCGLSATEFIEMLAVNGAIEKAAYEAQQAADAADAAEKNA